MNGYKIGTLSVDIVYENNLRQTIWQLTGDQSYDWMEANVGFSSAGMTYKYK
jgi:hypothetical protein